MAWAKGQSGNPKGTIPKGVTRNPHGRPPKGHALADVLRSEVDNQRVAQTVKQLIEDGDMKAIQFYADRTEGKVPETKNVNISGKVKVQLKWADDEQE